MLKFYESSRQPASTKADRDIDLFEPGWWKYEFKSVTHTKFGPSQYAATGRDKFNVLFGQKFAGLHLKGHNPVLCYWRLDEDGAHIFECHIAGEYVGTLKIIPIFE